MTLQQRAKEALLAFDQAESTAHHYNPPIYVVTAKFTDEEYQTIREALQLAAQEVDVEALKKDTSQLNYLFANCRDNEHGFICGYNQALEDMKAKGYLRQPVADWMPIETAPKDGTVFLICLPRMMNLIVRSRYDRLHGYFISDYDNEERLARPHFYHEGDLWHPMPPLPAPPADSHNTQGEK